MALEPVLELALVDQAGVCLSSIFCLFVWFGLVWFGLEIFCFSFSKQGFSV